MREQEGVFESDFDEADDLGRAVTRARDMLVSTTNLLSGQVRKLNALSEEERQVKGLDAVLKDLNRALAVADEMERKVADAKRIERGGDGFDLNEARAQIRGRLDRIRKQSGAGSISE